MVKIRIYFRGFLKSCWIFDFINEKAFNDYLISNKNNIKKYEIL